MMNVDLHIPDDQIESIIKREVRGFMQEPAFRKQFVADMQTQAMEQMGFLPAPHKPADPVFEKGE